MYLQLGMHGKTDRQALLLEPSDYQRRKLNKSRQIAKENCKLNSRLYRTQVEETEDRDNDS